MKKGVVFDFDGVVIDSFEVQRRALLESYRMVVGEGEPSIEEFFSHSGDSIENIFQQMRLPAAMVEPYKKISRENIDDIVVFDGITGILERLTKRGFCLGLCTGKNRERTVEILEYMDLKQYFNTVICSDDVKHPKPAPDSLSLALRLMGISRKRAVMVGDAPNDIKCAKSISVKSIAVTWGEMDREALEREGPDCIVDSVGEFEACIYAML